jgi:hypothetical protein
MSSKPKTAVLMDFDDTQIIQAEPSRFNHANVTRRDQINIINKLQHQDSDIISDTASQMTYEDEEIKDEEQEKWAIVDDENMDNFYQMYPESE